MTTHLFHHQTTESNTPVRIIVTGAAGFAGIAVTSALLMANYHVIAVIREDSPHNDRLPDHPCLTRIYADLNEYHTLGERIAVPCTAVIHLAWQGARNNFSAQYENVHATIALLESASQLGCKRFLGIGTQAEYGPHIGIIGENLLPTPTNAYGAAKLATAILTKERAALLNVEWIWGRIFSLYGKYEPSGRLLSDLAKNLRNGHSMNLSAATQLWDYLYVDDAADAILALLEKGHPGEIYNIANGHARPLRSFTEDARAYIAPNIILHYGDTAGHSIAPSIEKIKKHTNWKPKTCFIKGLQKGFLDQRNF